MLNEEVLCEMQNAGFNVTTCGDCGAIKLLGRERSEELTCEQCGFTEEDCWFPDLYVKEQYGH